MIRLNNTTYDILNRVVKYLLPAIATAYFSLAQIWGFSHAEEVVGTLAVLTTLFGVILALANSSYKADHLEPIDLPTKLGDHGVEAEPDTDLDIGMEDERTHE